jgi:transcriptional regulator with XRE-family HTH domain
MRRVKSECAEGEGAVKTLPELLERHLMLRQCTLGDLARRLGVDRTTLWDWRRRGIRPQPRLIGRIAEVLEIPIDDVLEALPREEASA